MPEWKSADPDLVREVVREGEVFLQGQLTLATSADQRAAALGGVFTAAGTAVIAGVIAALSLQSVPQGIVWAGGVAAALFITAAGLCLATVLPVGWWLPGNEPESWYGDVEAERKLIEALGEEAEHYQEKIIENRAVLKANARLYRWGVRSGILAPIVGFTLWWVLRLIL